MRTISATHSAFVKRVLPFLAIALAVVWNWWSDRDHASTSSYGWLFFVTVLLTAIMVAALRKGFWRMADTVEDHGDSLVVTRWRTRVIVPLSGVREMRRVPNFTGSEITLTLKQPCALGSDIQFLAPDRRNVPDIDETLDALAHRVEHLGSRAA